MHRRLLLQLPFTYSAMVSRAKIPKSSDSFNVRFTHYTPEDAKEALTKGKKAPLRAARVYHEHLKLDTTQADELTKLYATHQHLERLYTPDEASQLEARILLEANSLDAGSRKSLDDRWSARWTREKSAKAIGKRTLYQW